MASPMPARRAHGSSRARGMASRNSAMMSFIRRASTSSRCFPAARPSSGPTARRFDLFIESTFVPAGGGFRDALRDDGHADSVVVRHVQRAVVVEDEGRDRKSTRLNSSHLVISYAVFCLKKKIYDM